MLGCGRPPNSRCGGEASAIEATPATWAGTTFMITLEASGARPPGTYRPTRPTGIIRWCTEAPGPRTTSTTGSPSSAALTVRRRLIAVSNAARRSGSRRSSAAGQRLGRHPERRGHHPVELPGVLLQGGGAPRADVVADGPDDLDGGRTSNAARGTDCGVVKRAVAGEPPSEINCAQHGGSLRMVSSIIGEFSPPWRCGENSPISLGEAARPCGGSRGSPPCSLVVLVDPQRVVVDPGVAGTDGGQDDLDGVAARLDPDAAGQRGVRVVRAGAEGVH